MSSFDKVVKLACKPKAAPPKSKYLDQIIAATWSDDGAVHDVCKALAPRFREPNAIVVFKALIVLHHMMRNGAADNVLAYLSQSDVLRLRNVSAGNWEGYAAPENLQNYAVYLDSRIRAYRDIKHDAIRVQSENNRDMRNSANIEEEGYRNRKDRKNKLSPSMPSMPSRSKTIMGRKLRVMTVEKGLLRETKTVHKMIDALVECRFYLDNLEDELTITALRMLVKDLLILFQAGNEGVINVLEHYFEMSHIDAKEAMEIYRHFCTQTEHVVEFLGVARKLQNLLNVPIPNLKHAPVSLAGALQEYLDDPLFEQNRIEYKTNKEITERGVSTSSTATKDPKTKPDIPKSAPSTSTATSPTALSTSTSPQTNKGVADFFSAIEEEHPSAAQANSANTTFNQQGPINPFARMGNGHAFGQQIPQIATQPTGYLMPQQTAVPPSNPFGHMSQQSQAPGHFLFSSYMQPQATGFMQQPPQQPQQTGFLQPQQTSFLQPQATGVNPFRQSVLLPNSTGMALFGGSGPGPMGMNAMNANQQHQQMQSSQGLNGSTGYQVSQGSSPNTGLQNSSQSTGLFTPSPSTNGSTNSAFSMKPPARSASTPLVSAHPSSPPVAQPVKTHQTGTKNPFGPIVTTPPPVPKPPTLMELAMYGPTGTQPNGHIQQQLQGQTSQQQQHPQNGNSGAFGLGSSALNPGATDISGVASSFAFSNKSNAGSMSPTSPHQGSLFPQDTATSTTASGSTWSGSMFSSGLSSQPTGATATSSTPSFSISPPPSAAPLKPHLTGFAGLKPFKPSSSFGASLLESLPSIPGSSPTTPTAAGTNANVPSNFSSPMSTSFSSGASHASHEGFGINSQPTGAFGSKSSLGVGLRPQMTGGPNPFRASMAGGPNGGSPSFSNFSSSTPVPSLPGATTSTSQGFRNNMFGTGGNAFASSPNGNLGQPTQQQNNTFSSLI